jgi:hypothetical protein
VENKIDAMQGVKQLKKYTDLLAHFYKDTNHIIGKYFLTVQEDEPNDPTWSAITYANTVISAITQVLESKTDKISDYIRHVLNDYIHLMDEDEAEDNEKESLAQKFSQEQIRQIQQGKDDPNSDFPMAWKNLWVKYPKACEYLAKYNADPRKDVVKYFKDLKNLKNLKSFELPGSDLIFNVEKTGLRYARFSILSTKNAEHIIEISKSAPKKWLDSCRNLAFEISMSESVQKGGKPSKYTISAIFTLGPNFQDPDQRRRILINDIRSGLEEALVDDCAPFYTRLTSPKRLNPKGAKTLTGKELRPWIDLHIFTEEKGIVKLNENVMKIAAQANSGLNKFFARPQNPQLIQQI